MAAQAPEGEAEGARPSRIRVMRPEVEEVLKSPRRGRANAKLHKEDDDEDDAGARPRYDCAFQDEEKKGFAPPDVVWCKVRSHPWWPAQVFDAADASELALRHARRPGAPLVAYFWDRTFAWMDPSALRPFRAHFPRLAAQSTVSSYVASVDAALQEVTRRIEAGLSCSCSCSPPAVPRRQQIHNSGIREGAYGAVVDEVYMRDTFRARPFLDYISALGRSPLAGADRLDLATAMAQLRSFNRLRCPMDLPEFVIYQGIEDVAFAAPPEADADADADAEAAATSPHTKRKRTDKGGDAPAKEKRSKRHDESSSRNRDAPAKEQEEAMDRIMEDAADKGEAPANKDAAMVEDIPMPSTKQSKSKRATKASAEKKKKDAADKGESLPEAEPPAKEDDANKDSSMPSVEAADDTTLSKQRKSKRVSKGSAEKKKKHTSKDAAEAEAEPAKEDGSSMPSVEATDDTALSKQRKSKRVSKSAAETKKNDTSKDTADKGESLPETEPAKEDNMDEDISMPSSGAADDTLSKGRKSTRASRSSAKTKKNDASKDTDKTESVTEPAKEVAENEDSSMPSAEAADDTVSKGRKSKKSKSSAKTKKKNADNKESRTEPAKGVAENEDSSMPSAEATDDTVSKERNSKISTRSAKKKKKDADKKESLPEPAKEGAENEDSSMPSGGATDGASSKETNSKISTRLAKKKKKDAGKKESLQEPAKEKATGDGSSTPSARNRIIDTSMDSVDGILSERKSGRRLRSSHKIVEALEALKWPRKKDAGETTKVKDKDAVLPKEKNLGRRAGSARQKDKITITEDGNGLADGSVKDSASPVKKRLHLDVHSATENAPFAVSELGRKKKTLIELLAETATLNRSAGDKSKARPKRPLPSSTLKPEATPRTRGKSCLPASTEKPEDPGRVKDTVKTREKRSLPASTEKPERDTRSTMKSRGKSSLPSSAEEPDRSTKGTAKTRGKRSLPESTEDPDRVTKGTSGTKGKGSLPESTEEQEGPDERDMKDTMHTRKRKKLDTLGDLSSQPQPVSPKGSTKSREVKRKAAGHKSQASPVVKANGGISGDSSSQPEPLSPKRSARRKAAEPKPHTPPVVKANGEASQTRSRRAKNSEVTVPDKPPRSVKLGKGKKGALAEESPSCGEMLSQLCVGASDVKKMGKIAPKSASFLTDFVKSARACTSDVEEAVNTDCNASSPNAGEEIPEKAAADKNSSPHVDEEIPEKATDNVSSPHADEGMSEKATDNVSSPHADVEMPEKATDSVSSPHADVEMPEKATDNISSPHADEEIPEKAAADKVSSPHADDVVPEEAAEKVSSPNADEVIPEEAADKVSSPNADEAIPERAADEVSLAPANEETLLKVKEEVVDEETLEKAATEKVSNPHADEDNIPEKAADAVSSPPADVETPEKATEKVSCPPADKEITDKASNKVSSPHAEEEMAEKATEEVPSLDAEGEVDGKAAEEVSRSHAEEDMAGKPEEKVPSPHAEEEEMAEKAATNSEPAPSEPPAVADHMKDNYWSDILINVEEPLASLVKKKDKGKMRSSKKQRHADEIKQDEMPPVTVTSVVDEPKAESQQDNAEGENGKANGGGQASTAAEEAESDQPLTGLVLHFSKPGAVPSRGDLIKIFSQYGPVSEARTETDEHCSSAQVVFKRRMDAEAAFGSAGKIAALRPGLASFRLTDFPCAEAAAAAFWGGDGPTQE